MVEREIEKMKMYACSVYHKGFGWDEYLVTAEHPKEAEKECRYRLDNETDYPAKEWEIVDIKEVD